MRAGALGESIGKRQTMRKHWRLTDLVHFRIETILYELYFFDHAD